jgi:phosphoglycolate phosphatase-like HAD superfamily hydrolase
MSLDISRIRGLCFDIDGTLRDTDNRLVEQVSAWLHPIRSIIGKEDLPTLSRRMVMAIENPSNYLHSLADRLGIDSTIDAFENLVYRMGLFQNTDDYLIIPGTHQMLTRFQLHFPMAIVTARGEVKTMAFLYKFELTSFFDAIATWQTCAHTKPFPDPVVWAAKQMGVPPEACLMIGDTVFDIRAGKAAGAQTVGVLCGFGEQAELRQAGADLILEKPSDLVDILLTDSLAE